MAGMDGFAVVAELAARKARIPVILMTAPVTETMRRRAREAGVFSLLEKPLLDGVLADNIRRATA
jgi:CheY-like chemotaxis protein